MVVPGGGGRTALRIIVGRCCTSYYAHRFFHHLQSSSLTSSVVQSWRSSSPQTLLLFSPRTSGRRSGVLKVTVQPLTALLWFSRPFTSGKQESYFSAIGGDSDEPPPDLSPSQVTTILRTNESLLINCSPLVASIETNQLASNHPIEDRLRVARVQKSPLMDDALFLGVFDGHGGGTCAEVVSSRLYHYITLALSKDPVKMMEEWGSPTPVETLTFCPKSEAVAQYNEEAQSVVKTHVSRNEVYFLARYAERLKRMSPDELTTTENRIKDAFVQCDVDLSEEIQYNLITSKSNLLKHFYLSLAISGCCANVVVLHGHHLYVANTGDCRAVMGVDKEDEEKEKVVSGNRHQQDIQSQPTKHSSCPKTILLSRDHNADNVDELKRIFEAHPKQEQNNIIRYGRLLGQLMPLRAFGDFGYKWPVKTIKAVGLTQAYGPHVIPPFYQTPPYLTVEPEVTSYDLSSLTGRATLVIATDGLWEQFESSHEVTDVLYKYAEMTRSSRRHSGEEDWYPLEHEDTIELPPLEGQEEKKESKASSNPGEEEDDVDGNRATYLLRSSLSQLDMTMYDHVLVDSLDVKRLYHQKLVSYLTLPESVVRNFRDDISLIVVRF